MNSGLTQLNAKTYQQLLCHASAAPDFAYIGSVGSGEGRGSFSGFSALATTTRCVTAEAVTGLDTGTLSREMDTLTERYRIPPAGTPGGLTGGWIGFLSYEFGYLTNTRLVAGPPTARKAAPPAPTTPLLQAGFYLWAASHNRLTDSFHLWIHPQCPDDTRRRLQQWTESDPKSDHGQWHMEAAFRARQPADQFVAGVDRVQRYINAGDCYQTNLSQEFEGRYCGSPWLAFRALAEANPTPYSAFLKTGTGAVLSISPERFLEITEGVVRTSPIKGTRPRGNTPEADAAYAAELEASEKDRAENLMIVDLLRNDLGVHAITGSVTVERLFALESYRNVHHLVSHIRARLGHDVSPLQVLFDAFPGGSITGAPKIRAMEIIQELEPHWRGPYCGSVFYHGLDGRLDSNIAIRTLLCESDRFSGLPEEAGRIRCWGGGGIVADSDPQSEYQETLTKVKPLMDFLETLNPGS